MSSGLILLVVIFKCINRRRSYKNIYRHTSSFEEIESIPNNDSWSDSNNHVQDRLGSLSTNPITLIHGGSQSSFFFTFQQFLHVCLVILPIIDLIVHATLKSSTEIQGVNVFYCSSSLLVWLIGLFVLRYESHQFFKARRSSHSLGLLLFWSLSFITENLSFISWNNDHWWFHSKTSMQKAELGLFIARYVCISLLFLLGIYGPGLYKPEPVVEVNKVQGPDDGTNVVGILHENTN